MPAQFCGLDFGTTNSSVAVSNGMEARVLDLDPLNDSPTSLPSMLYITNEGDHIVGRGAANAFIERNVDREVVLKEVDLGVDIEAYVMSEMDKEGGYRPRDDGNEIRDAVRAVATVEVDSPGRLFQSIKSYLRHRAFEGTEVYGRHYQIEELVASILSPMKQALDTEMGTDVDSVVLGRPVRFSTRDEENLLAESRLRRAATIAGFKNITFFYEPVAACLEYAVRTDRTQRLMVVDIGGGTCDVCIMEFGGSQGAAARLAESRILGVAGSPVAGDVLDRHIMRAKLFPRFGSRARYGPDNLPMPQYIYNNILDWQSLYRLNTEEIMNWLIAVEGSSGDPEGIRALRTLIRRNFGYPVLRAVEQAKKALSHELDASVVVHMDGIHFSEMLNRREFEEIIHYPLEDMLHCIQEAEQLAGVNPEGVDCVLTTGGTSLIPAVRHMLAERYGPETLVERDTFTSVAAGLAIVAQYI